MQERKKAERTSGGGPRGGKPLTKAELERATALIEAFVHTLEGTHALRAEKQRVAHEWAVRDAPLKQHGLPESEREALREQVLMDAFGE